MQGEKTLHFKKELKKQFVIFDGVFVLNCPVYLGINVVLRNSAANFVVLV